MALVASSSNKNSSLHDKLENLREMMDRLRSKATDIQHEIRNEELQVKKKRKSEVTLWLEQVTKIEEKVQSITEKDVNQVSFFRRGELSDKLEGLMDNVEQLLKESEFSRGILLDDINPKGLELVPRELEGSTPLKVGDEVWSCFERGERRVGIHGMGGVGKTTLAMHINNNILKQAYLFDGVYYVTVSRETTIFKLQSDIAKALGLRLDYEDEPKRAAELRMALTNRQKSLLILDDVWENIVMENVGVSVEGDVCKLLITTRKREVCRKMNCFEVKMYPLSRDESWDLFKKQLGDFESLSDEIKETAELVAKECDGLPLGIITMAGSMRGETGEHVWRYALKRLQNPEDYKSAPDMKEDVFRILRFSYYRLPEDKHRECFLYCALYPEDYKINRDDLVTQFIAEGLLDGTTREEGIDEGRSLLDALENASLLEDVSNSGGWNCVRMHDLVRDMAIEIIGSTGMVKGGKGLEKIPIEEEWINKDLEWVSLMDNEIENIGVIICHDLPNISVLLLQNNPLKSVPDSFFSRMTGLRVVNLSDTRVGVLPNSVSSLCNLNCLLLSRCRELHYVPSLAKLTKLRELDLQHCYSMTELPEGMEELESLEHLNLVATGVKILPDVVSSLSNLRTLLFDSFYSRKIPSLAKVTKLRELGLYDTDIIVPLEELMSLRHLEKLGRIQFGDVSWVSKLVGVGSFHRWKTYFVTVGCAIRGQVSVDIDRRILGVDIDRRILVKGVQLRGEECFLVPRNVSGLWLWKCKFFGVGSLLDAMPSLCDATQVECCEFSSCKGIEYVISEGWTKPLQGIQQLKLRKLVDFGGLIREGVVNPYISFSGLRDLEIRGCRKVKKLWLLNLDLPNLEVISIAYCGEMEEIFATEMGGTVEFPRLRSLELRSLPKLRRLWGNCSVIFPLLVRLDLSSFPTMKNIGPVSCNLPCLEEIRIDHCEQMEEIFAAEKGETVELPKLIFLKLSDLHKLRSIWGACSALFHDLVSLEVSECPEVKKIGLVSRNLPYLEEISICNCKQMEEIFAMDNGETVELPKLRSLKLLDLPELRSIGGNCNVLFHDLVSLKISECPKVKRIGLVSRKLLSLDEIDIQHCQQMEELFATEKGETVELPKLRSLELRDLPELRSIWGNCNVLFHDLVALVVSGCPKLKKIGLVSRNLLYLEFIVIMDCEQMEEIFAVEDEAGDDNIQLGNLKTFNLWESREVRSISRKTIVCNSLQSIVIGGTGILKLDNCPISVPRLSLNDNNGPLPDIGDWWDPLHWNDPSTKAFFHQHGIFPNSRDLFRHVFNWNANWRPSWTGSTLSFMTLMEILGLQNLLCNLK